MVACALAIIFYNNQQEAPSDGAPAPFEGFTSQPAPISPDEGNNKKEDGGTKSEANPKSPENAVDPARIEQKIVSNEPSPPKRIPILPERREVVIVDLQNWKAVKDGAAPDPKEPPAAALSVPLGNHLISSPSIIAPSSPSEFLAVNVGENEVRYEILNYRVGRYPTPLQIPCGIADKLSLHRDGIYVAVQRSFGKRIEVWSVDDKKIVLDLANQWGGLFSGFMDFVDKSLVVFDSRDSLLRYYDVPSGEFVRETRFPTCIPKCISLSPGQRYMAIADLAQSFVYLVDLESLPSQAIKLSVTRDFPVGAAMSCQLRFSPQGDRVAGLFKSMHVSRIICWNLLTGKEEQNHTLKLGPEPNGRGVTDSFEWFPEADGWLVDGRHYVDTTRGGPAASLKLLVAKHQTPLHVTSDGRLLVVSEHEKQRTLESLALPKEQITQAVARFVNGEHPGDAQFPATKRADIGKAIRLTPPPTPVTWQVELRAVEAPPEIEESIQLARSRRELDSLLIAEGAAQAVLCYDPADGSKNQPEQPRRIEIYELKTRKLLCDFPIKFPAKPVAVRSDGSQILLKSDNGDRLDVIQPTPNEGKHVLGFRPYDTHTDAQKAQITSAQFVGENHVLTMNRGGSIVLWKLPECQAVYEYRTNLTGQVAPVVSPDGKYVAVAGEHTIQLLQALTGKCYGRVETGVTVPVTAMAFDPQGSRLAAGFRSDDASRLKVWKLNSGEEAADVPLYAEPTGLVWCGANHLLCSGQYLADLTKQALVWKYQVPTGRMFPNNNFGRCWYVSAPVAHEQPTLVGISLPDNQVNAKLSRTPIRKPLFPGDATIGLNFDTPLCPEPIRDKLRTNVTAMVAGSKHEMSDDAPFQLKVNARETPTGRKMTVGGILLGLPGGEPQSVEIDEVKVVVEIADKAGSTVWKIEKKFETGPLDVTSAVTEGGSLHSSLRLQLWTKATAWINAGAMPSVVHPNDVREGYGESHLTSEGPQVRHDNSMPSAAKAKPVGVTGAKSL